MADSILKNGVRFFICFFMKIGIISDVHEDAIRLQESIKSLEKLGCDEYVCLGDISGFDPRFYSYIYSKDFKYCMDMIKSYCKIIIPGNHDLFHLKRIPENNPEFQFPNDWYELPIEIRRKLGGKYVWLYEKEYPINSSYFDENVFSNFDSQIVVTYDGLSILFSHSITPDLSGMMRKKPRKKHDFFKHLENIENKQCLIGISGHLHPNGLLKVDRKKIYNPKFTKLDIPSDKITQFIVPCVADGMQDNGYTILDTINLSIESFPLRTPRHNFWL